MTGGGLAEIRRWLRETEPDRRVRSEGALRPFFLWLLEPDEAASQLEAERAYWHAVLGELERIREEPTGTGRKAKTFRIVLEGGVRSVAARLDWLEWALGEVRSPAWRDAH